MTRSHRTAVFRFVLICVSVVAALACAELILRSFSIKPRIFFIQKNRLRLSDDPALGYEMVPGKQGINEWGFRGSRVIVPKPSGTYRILVLGDSIAYGCCEIPLEKTFAKRLEAKLNASSGGTHYEVLDAGVLGYNTLQEAEYYGAKLYRLEPDLIILQVALNDYLPMTFEFDTLALSQKNPDARLAAYNYYALARRFGKFIFSFNLVKNAVYAYELVRGHVDQKIGTSAVLGEAVETADAGKVLAYNLSKYSWVESDIIQRGMENLRTNIGSSRIPVVTAVFPIFIADMQSYPQRYRLQHTDIDSKSNAEGFRTVDLLSCYQSSWQAGVPFDIGDNVHPNAYGHERAADCLYTYLTAPQML